MPLDLTGTRHGLLEVISRHSSHNKQVRWNVICLSCSKEYQASSDKIVKNVLGCAQCARLNAPKGSDSIYWRGGKYISSIFMSNVAYGAKKRSIVCEITIPELDALWEKQDGRCAYTNRQLELGTECTASLDRIDSSLGYTSSNVQFVHKTVNVMKWALTEKEFLQFISEIYTHRSKDGLRV